MTNVHGYAFLLGFPLDNRVIAETQWRKVFVEVFTSKSETLFSANYNRVLRMSSWSRRVKIRGVKTSIEAQLPTVSGYLKKMLYSCSCMSFVSGYCVLMKKIRRKWQLCDQRSLFPSPSRITSRLLRRLESVAWRIVESHCARVISWHHVNAPSVKLLDQAVLSIRWPLHIRLPSQRHFHMAHNFEHRYLNQRESHLSRDFSSKKALFR